MISKASDKNPTKWDKRLPLLLFVYRSVHVHATLSIFFELVQVLFTPAHLVPASAKHASQGQGLHRESSGTSESTLGHKIIRIKNQK